MCSLCGNPAALYHPYIQPKLNLSSEPRTLFGVIHRQEDFSGVGVCGPLS
jgi:hypothetical protein